jgi:hypothetical protein
MKKYTLLMMFTSVLVYSCKPGSAGGEASIPEAALGKPVEEVYLLSNQKGLQDSTIQNQRVAAEKELRQRIDTSARQLVSVLEKDLYQIQAVLRGSEVVFDEKVKAGWIDFAPDNTYKYGVYADQMGGGRYHFDASGSLILLVDYNQMIKPQEFQALINGDALVLVGQDTYRDNNMQAKLNRMPEMPVSKQKSSDSQ